MVTVVEAAFSGVALRLGGCLFSVCKAVLFQIVDDTVARKPHNKAIVQTVGLPVSIRPSHA